MHYSMTEVKPNSHLNLSQGDRDQARLGSQQITKALYTEHAPIKKSDLPSKTNSLADLISSKTQADTFRESRPIFRESRPMYEPSDGSPKVIVDIRERSRSREEAHMRSILLKC